VDVLRLMPMGVLVMKGALTRHYRIRVASFIIIFY
jgi:hypothetical protein